MPVFGVELLPKIGENSEVESSNFSDYLLLKYGYIIILTSIIILLYLNLEVEVSFCDQICPISETNCKKNKNLTEFCLICFL